MRIAPMRRMTFAVATVFAVAFCSAVALNYLPVPFFWIGLSWGLAGYVVAALAPRSLKLPIILVACVPFALGFGELMLPPVVYRAKDPFPFREDALFGWSLRPSQVSRAMAEAEGALIYDVTYSTDSAGFRVAPPDRGDRVEGCLFFFSDSYPFGEGVNDDQTFPYQVGLQTSGRFRVVNLSVPGYGAEHMLAAMAPGTLATDPPCEPTHVFYTAIPHHILRAAAKTPFSGSGPRYRLTSKGIPEYLGTTPERSPSLESGTWRGWLELLKDQLRKSRILRSFKDRPPKTSEADINLYFAIAREAFQLFKLRWPKAERHLISWDSNTFYSNGQSRFHQGMAAIDAQIHFIDDVLPGYTQDPTKYGIHPLDLHPNADAHELVASYISERILSSTRAAKPARFHPRNDGQISWTD
jgi:hypothetical protein